MSDLPNNLVTLEQAQKLADLGYRGPTEYFWDRYNSDIGGTDATAWRISKSRSTFDDTCCLAAPELSKYNELVKKYE